MANISSFSSATSPQSQSRKSLSSKSSLYSHDAEHPLPPIMDPSVIVGMACRMPGASNTNELWDLMATKRDMRRKVPEDRFNVDAFYHPEGSNKGTTNSKYGYFLDQDLRDFDAEFFRISGKEAEAMDPQQRLLLEVVYEALENAGITLQEISGSQTSVFAGSFTNDYNSMITKDLAQYPKYIATGAGNAILSNRISYFYNLHGASMTVDTACSSSLICFHLGHRSLQDKEADISIIVGSALHFDPTLFITMTDFGFLSTDGRCRAFDAFGKGYVRGEGVCAVILKRKSLAELAGDRIRAIVRATGANHDGLKEGITLPNSKAQENLIRRTYESAGLDPADTAYFESHGTGTAQGDPREARAIGAVFSPNRAQPLIVGSIKTNVGHLEGASGLAGIIKTVLCLENGKIVPNMHFDTPNTSIEFDKWKIEVPTKVTDWPIQKGFHRASVNSFGYGGSNAHVILESTPQAPMAIGEDHATRMTKTSKGRPFLIPYTSHSEKAGKIFVSKLSKYLEEKPELNLVDLAYSLSVRRSMHVYRSFSVAADSRIFLDILTNPTPVVRWTRTNHAKPRLGFVFTGQGVQWFAMGRQLIELSPLFKKTLDRCDEILQLLPDSPNWSCVEELLRTKDSTRVAQSRFSQPLCVALQLALVDLLKAWQIEPVAVVGHSSGEIPAAYAAGILSFENALICAYYRGLYMSSGLNDGAPKKGAMVAVGLTEAEAQVKLKPYKGKVTLAAINSASSLTLSGDEDAILELKDYLEKNQVFVRRLQVAQAFHSHHMDSLAVGFQQALERTPAFKPQHAKARMFSSVTARPVNPAKMGAEYWAANMTEIVRFSDALTGILLDDLDEVNVDVLIEVGAHPALRGPSEQVMKSLKVNLPYLATLTRGTAALEGLLVMAGQLFTLGYPVDLVAVNNDHFDLTDGTVSMFSTAQLLSDLPSYPWDHAKYWSETRVIRDHRFRKHRKSVLGASVPGSLENRPRWRNYLRQSELPWLSHHIIEGNVVFPAAGYISMAIEAVSLLRARPEALKDIVLRDVMIKSALQLSDSDAGTEVILEMEPLPTSAKGSSDVWFRFVISSYDTDQRYTENCHGLISTRELQLCSKTFDLSKSFDQLLKASNRSVPLDKYYDRLELLGLQYGETFKLISGSVESGPGFAMAPLTFNPARVITIPADACILHPTLLDASFHVIFAAIESQLGRPLDEPFIPTFIRSLEVSGRLPHISTNSDEQKFWVVSDTKLPGPRVAHNDLTIGSEPCTEPLVHVRGLEVTALSNDFAKSESGRSLFFRTRWRPAFDRLGSALSPAPHGISDLMDIFAHQFPDSKILHLTPSAESTRDVLRYLGGRAGERRRFRSLCRYSYSKDAFDKSGSPETEWPDLVVTAEPQKEKYDLIIIEERVNTDVTNLLKSDGYILNYNVCFDGQGFVNVFQGAKYSLWRAESAPAMVPANVTLVMPAQSSWGTDAVATALEATCRTTMVRIFFSQILEKMPSSENIAVLASLDEDLLFADGFNGSVHFEAIRKLLTSAGKNIVWVLAGATGEVSRPQHALIHGLARVARSECDQMRLVILDVGPGHDPQQISQHIAELFNRRLDEDEIALRNGTLFIPRIENDDILNSKLPNSGRRAPRLQALGRSGPLALKIGKVGLLETLAFEEDEEILDKDLADDDIEIKVRASAINFRDIAASMGIIDDHRLGDECAGEVVRIGSRVGKHTFEIGDRVVAWRPGQGAHRSTVRNPAMLCQKIDSMPFAIATAFSGVLTTAYYSLVDIARLQRGETCLVHSAAGGVGQMAVQLAQMVGAKVLVTVGSQSKRDLLRRIFSLQDKQMFSSRDDSFVDGVMKATDGQGVDVALNSLAGDLLHATWRCIAPFGRLVEIGKRDIQMNTKLDMDPFRKNVSYASVDLITIFEKNKSLGSRLLRECYALISNGTVKPPEPITKMSYAEAQKGFRMLQMGRHTGKVVLVCGDDDIIPVIPATYRNRNVFDSSRLYLLVGGLGGLGRTLAEWMVRKGARNIAFLSRSGTDRAEAKTTVHWLKLRGIHVSVYRGDVTDEQIVTQCIQSLGAKLAGIFQASMVLQDAPLDKMTYKQWQLCVQPKVNGTYNLHKATTNSKLDFFVCFSSGSSIIGSMGQSNYSAANCYMDALMRYRREIGLPGTSIDVGMIVGIGAVAEDAELRKIMERIGYDRVTEQELLYQVEEAVCAETISYPLRPGVDAHQIISGINTKRKDLFWVGKPLLRNLYLNGDFEDSPASSGNVQSLITSIQNAEAFEQRVALLLAGFVEKIAKVLAVKPETIQSSNALSAYGLDSIVAVELRKWFMRMVGVDLALFDILSAKSITSLVSKVVGLVALKPFEKDKPMPADFQNAVNKTFTGMEQAPEQAVSAEFRRIQRPCKIPMSSYQNRIWFIHNLVRDKSSLNFSVVCNLKGEPDLPTLNCALLELTRRNDMLRTSYFEGEDFAEQRVIENMAPQLEQEDFSSKADPTVSLDSLINYMRSIPFKIEQGEVMRGTLVRLSNDQWALVFIFHHIAIDNGSTRSSINQFTSIYDALRRSTDLASIPSPQISYIDFTLWHNADLEWLADDVQFWKDKLSGAPEAGQLLPFARNQRPPVQESARNVVRNTLELPALIRMKRICGRMETTPFQFLLAAWRSFLYRYTNDNDVTILMLDGNRPHPDLEDVVGFFVNMIPIRFTNDCDTTFDHLLENTKSRTLEAMEHSRVPFDTIVDAVQAKKNQSHFPLSQVAINYQMYGKPPKYMTRDFTVEAVSIEDIPTACELSLEVLEDPVAGLTLRLDYGSYLYGGKDMERFFDNFLTYLTSVIKDYRQPIDEIDLCGPKELEHLRSNFWALAVTENTWNHLSVVTKIIEAARAVPQATAIETSDNQQITYQKLMEKAQSIRSTLQRNGAELGQHIGVLCQPGIEAITAMVGVLFAGCAFVPLDPEFAVDRLAFMVRDSSSFLVLVGEGMEPLGAKLACEPGFTAISMAASSAILHGEVLAPSHTSGDSPFYIMYTSGSTGNPKGVVVKQSNMQEMLSTLHHEYHFNPQDKFLNQTSMCFDASMVQIFSALTARSSIAIATAGTRKDPLALAAYMRKVGVTFTLFTPTQFALLLEYAVEDLRECSNYRLAFFIGEVLPARIVQRFYELGTPAIVHNTFGPTELTVQMTIHKAMKPGAGAKGVPVGLPLANSPHYIVDPCLKPLPAGLIGELCVGGAQVATGYIGRPDANEKAFVTDPFCSSEHLARGWSRMYKTGDKARFLPDGQLEFHGRIAGDKQIKLRGFRIDLAEVEERIFLESTCMTGQRLVDVAVVARRFSSEQSSLTDERYLIAFIVPKNFPEARDKGAFVASLHERIGKHLNDYMLPSCYQFLSHLPMTIGGKVDRLNLLARSLDLTWPSPGTHNELTCQKPSHNRNDLVDLLIKIIRDVLKLPEERKILPTDNFFDLGGQSILLLRLQSKIKRALQADIALPELFKLTTPLNLSQAILSDISKRQEHKVTHTTIDWDKETILPKDKRYTVPCEKPLLSRSEATNILVSGVDGFIGLHTLVALLFARPSAKIHVIGSQKKVDDDILIQFFHRFRLFGGSLDEAFLLSRTRCIQGTIGEPYFGIGQYEFRDLGRAMNAIYHCGGEVSLLKNYTDLKRMNVTATLQFIELASYGEFRTDIHHLSTWSVPHLQTWKACKRARNTVDVCETIVSHFQPPIEDEFGYFKSRWVAEMLMSQAAERGFSVSIFRSSAVTPSTVTKVPTPDDDFTSNMVAEMINLGHTIDFGDGDPPFAIDFVPVDYLTAVLSEISSSDRTRSKDLSIYHIGNPIPLRLSDLPTLMAEMRDDGLPGSSLPLDQWLNLFAKKHGDQGQLERTVFQDYVNKGHVMFALDHSKTSAAMELVGCDAVCPPVDTIYLRDLMEGRSQRRVTAD